MLYTSARTHQDQLLPDTWILYSSAVSRNGFVEPGTDYVGLELATALSKLVRSDRWILYAYALKQSETMQSALAVSFD